MGSNDAGADEALRTISAELKRRDDELDSLRQEIERLKSELTMTAGERDHLRRSTEINDQRDELYRRKSSASGASGNLEDGQQPEIDFATLEGESKAQKVEDSRIGRPKRILIIGGGPAGLITTHEFLNPVNRPVGESLEGYTIQCYERRAEIGGVWYFEPENDIAKGWHDGPSGWNVGADDLAEENEDLDGYVNGNGTGPNQDAEEKVKHDLYDHLTAGDMELLDPLWFKQNKSAPSLDGSNAKLTNGVSPPNGRRTSSTAGEFCYFNGPRNAPRWPSPAYEGLVGNVLPPLLEFGAKKMPKPKEGLFPSMVETHNYLLSLGKPLRPYIKTNQEVVDARPEFRNGSDTPTWVVTVVDWSEEGDGAERTEEWDAILSCVGAFDHPFYPPLDGISPLVKQRSSLLMHAKSYPGPRPFLNQHNKFVVIGNANSANDIAAHLAPLNSSGPVYRCIRHPSYFAHLPDPRIKDVAPISQIRQSTDRKTVSVTLDDGTKIDGVTKLISASGYEYRFSWVQVPDPYQSGHPKDKKLHAASKHGSVPNLHNITFHADVPTLSFIGLSQGSSPMPLAEIQARTAARTYYGLYKLPESTKDMLAGFEERAHELGITEDEPDKWRTLHMVRGPPERTITHKLIDDLEASEEGSTDGLFRWDDWREGVAKNLRRIKENELRRLRDAKVAAGGVDGGPGGVLSYGPRVGQKFTPVVGKRQQGSGRSLML